MQGQYYDEPPPEDGYYDEPPPEGEYGEGEGYPEEDGPQIVPPTDDRAAAILDGFRMCVRAHVPRSAPLCCGQR